MALHSLTIRGLTRPLLERLRAAAKRHRRSLNSEVLELLERASAGPEPEHASTTVRETARSPYPSPSPGLGAQRLAQLEADLRLTPEQRVHEAEDIIEMALRFHKPPRVARVLAFETYDDYLRWKSKDVLW